MRKKIYKNLLVGGFYFFLIKGLIWLFIIGAAALGIGNFFNMYIAMNRFKIVIVNEKAFEDVWKNRETHLENVPGFEKVI